MVATLRARFALLMALAVTALGVVNRYYFEARFLGELESELERKSGDCDEDADTVFVKTTVSMYFTV